MAPAFTPKQWALSHLFLALLLALSLWAFFDLRPVRAITFLNIGQGDSVLIQTPEHRNILIDAGPDGKVVDELSATLPFFNRRIDAFILSHPHRDHMAGILDILGKYPVGMILMTGVVSNDPLYDSFLRRAHELGIPIFFPENQKDLQIGRNLVLDILYPFSGKSMIGHRVDNQNNASLSLILRGVEGEPLAMLSGDAEREEERELLLSGQDLSAPLYNHHGSRTSSSPPFLAAVRPNTAVISCGVDNSFKHPHPETLDKFAALGLTVHRTDLEGRVILEF